MNNIFKIISCIFLLLFANSAFAQQSFTGSWRAQYQLTNVVDYKGTKCSLSVSLKQTGNKISGTITYKGKDNEGGIYEVSGNVVGNKATITYPATKTGGWHVKLGKIKLTLLQDGNLQWTITSRAVEDIDGEDITEFMLPASLTLLRKN